MTIGLLNVPNQTLTVRLAKANLLITLLTHNGLLYATVSHNDEIISAGVRCVSGQRITPRSVDSLIGGFLCFKTNDGSYPDYNNFDAGCTLEYEEINV